MLSGLYVLTDDQIYAHASWPDRVESVLRGGTDILQLREKNLTDDALLPTAYAIQEICSYYNALFIINDRVQLGKKINADGIHIGKDDQQVHDAREYLGNQFLIGASCYRNINSALKAQRQGADYVAFGSIFSSITKKNAPRCPMSTLRNSKRILSIPVCAIGGIKDTNIKSVLSTGIDMIAVSDAVFNTSRPDLAANKLIQQVIMSRQLSE